MLNRVFSSTAKLHSKVKPEPYLQAAAAAPWPASPSPEIFFTHWTTKACWLSTLVLPISPKSAKMISGGQLKRSFHTNRPSSSALQAPCISMTFQTLVFLSNSLYFHILPPAIRLLQKETTHMSHYATVRAAHKG